MADPLTVVRNPKPAFNPASEAERLASVEQLVAACAEFVRFSIAHCENEAAWVAWEQGWTDKEPHTVPWSNLFNEVAEVLWRARRIVAIPDDIELINLGQLRAEVERIAELKRNVGGGGNHV